MQFLLLEHLEETTISVIFTMSKQSSHLSQLLKALFYCHGFITWSVSYAAPTTFGQLIQWFDLAISCCKCITLGVAYYLQPCNNNCISLTLCNLSRNQCFWFRFDMSASGSDLTCQLQVYLFPSLRMKRNRALPRKQYKSARWMSEAKC